MIAGEYARSTHAFHGCSPEILKSGLLGTVDVLWATAQADPPPTAPEVEPNLIELLLAASAALP